MIFFMRCSSQRYVRFGNYSDNDHRIEGVLYPRLSAAVSEGMHMTYVINRMFSLKFFQKLYDQNNPVVLILINNLTKESKTQTNPIVINTYNKLQMVDWEHRQRVRSTLHERIVMSQYKKIFDLNPVIVSFPYETTALNYTYRYFAVVDEIYCLPEEVGQVITSHQSLSKAYNRMWRAAEVEPVTCTLTGNYRNLY